ncbi:HNH endonuclease [Streptomyces tendae]|uniref:HNH endonuclease n=1 Tax=Streptomyces tendae TaxID=1932 RepID=UPI0036FA4141
MNAKARNRKGRPSTAQRKKYRAKIAERDGRACLYCAHPFADDLTDATLDHYVPWTLWRSNRVINLVLACERCNLAKADALPLPLVWLLLAVYRPENWELTA